MRSVLLVAFFLLLASTSQAVDINVPGDYSTIQAAIDAATSTDRVVVGPGTYAENITLKDAVDVLSTDGPGSTTIDGGGVDVRTVVADGVVAIFEGFTITGGDATTNGGGMQVVNNSILMVVDCVFTGNNADGQGGGMSVQGAQADVSNCVFSMNTAAGGAAVYVDDTQVSEVFFTDCEMYDNTATGPGGAMTIRNGAADIVRCSFHGNTATNLGGAISSDGSELLVSECAFYLNTGSEGGGVSMNAVSSGEIDQCTFYMNSAALGGCISCTNDSDPTISYSILAGSTAGAALDCGLGSEPIVDCCDMFGNDGGDALPACAVSTGNNISADPQFCMVAPEMSGIFTLQSDSPCTALNSACGLIGRDEEACGTDSVDPSTWGRIKSSYR